MKIHPRHSHLLFSLTTSMIVAGIVTCVLTAVNFGYTDFVWHWSKSFLIAWPIAFLAVFFISPRIHRLIKRIAAE
jgi:hypothetical protein